MYKVWVIKNNGNNNEEHFNSAQESINYAKECSLRALCAFRTQGNGIVTYQYGEQVTDQQIIKDLYETTEAIENSKNEFYAKDGRGKACRRKV
jgi:hypothetical protein